MSAAALWAAVVVSYEVTGLINLTNPRDTAAVAIDTTQGEDAAQEVIDLWDLYAQESYDASDSQHVTVGKRGCIAVLWQRGGTSSSIAKVEWDEVFSSDGTISKVRRTGPRGRQGPSSNSGVSQRSERTSDGQRVRGWSDPDSLPSGRSYMPRRIVAED